MPHAQVRVIRNCNYEAVLLRGCPSATTMPLFSEMVWLTCGGAVKQAHPPPAPHSSCVESEPPTTNRPSLADGTKPLPPYWSL